MARKTYEINDELLADLEPFQASHGLTETALMHMALSALLQAFRRGLSIYLSDTPEGGDDPTSRPPAAPTPPLRMVENQAKRGVRPPTPRSANTRRAKK